MLREISRNYSLVSRISAVYFFSLSSKFKVKKMASIVASLPSPLLIHGKRLFFGNVRSFPVAFVGGKQNHVAFLVKATGEGTDSSTSFNIVKSVQNILNKSEDRLALIGLGFAGIVAVWASANLISVIDGLPLIPSLLELVGILFSTWFVYRYLLFKPDREELVQIINKSLSDVLGQ